MSSMTLSMLLMLKDMASGPLGQFMGKLGQTSAKLMTMGMGARMMGQSILGAMKEPIDAFREAEDAGTSLKVSMMGATGEVSKQFGAVNKLATDLGNKLPGTTADFQNMMTVLLQNGTTADNILGGVGKSAAYLGVQLKMPFDSAAKFASKVGEAAGVAAKDMEKFMDVIQRTANLGVETGEMQYAFGRSAGALKNVGLQGLATAESLSVMYAQLIKGGLSGETVGTNFAGILDGLKKFQYGIGDKATAAQSSLKALGIEMSFLDKSGKFIGIRHMIAQLEKLKNIAPDKKAKIMDQLFGGGQDGQMISTLINGGVKAYDEMQQKMKAQADLNKKVEAQLKTLTNIWDAATGTFRNMLATLGESVAPELKAMADGFGKLAEKIQQFAKEHPNLTKMATALTLLAGVGLFTGGTALMGVGMIGSGLSTAAPVLTKVGTAAGKLKNNAGNMVNALGAWNNATGALLVSKAKLATAPGAIGKKMAGLRVESALTYEVMKKKAVSTASGIKTSFMAVPGAIGQVPSKIKALGVAMMAMPSKLGGAITALPGTLKTLAGAAYGKILGGLRAITMGIRAMSLAALANPVGLVIAAIAIAIAAAAVLVYKYWKPISGFFKGLWQGLKAGLSPLRPAFMKAFGALAPILNPIMGALKGVWNWLKNLLSPVDDVGNRGQKMGVQMGMAIAGIIKKGAEMLAYFISLPGQFASIGRNMMQGLLDGISAMAGSVLGKLRDLAGQAKAAFANVLGIHSPSRVFMGFGVNMGQGLEIGMASKMGQLRQVAGKMAQAAMPRFPVTPVPALNFSQASGAALPAVRRAQAGMPSGAHGGATMQVTFAPVIQLAPGSPYGQQIDQAMDMSFVKFKRLMDQYLRENKRIGSDA